MSHVGRRIEGDIHPGLGGTVVNENPSSGRWPRMEQTYDVLWDDGTCSRRVASAILEGSWRFRHEPRVSKDECRKLWFDFLVAMSRQLTERHAGKQPVQPPAAEPRLAIPQPPIASGMEAVVKAQPLHSAVPSARLVRQAALALLSDRYPSSEFGVHCERRVLSVAWMDGPLQGSVWKALSALVDQRAVTSVRVNRGLSEEFVQAAVDYCLWRACPADAERGRLALRVNAQAYLEGSLDLVRPDGGPAAGLPFQSMVRCVIERWDDNAQTFRNTSRTQGLVREMAAMFPDDEQARRHFRMFRAAVTASAQRGRDAISQLASQRVVRERP